jgi:hypothetical protein
VYLLLGPAPGTCFPLKLIHPTMSVLRFLFTVALLPLSVAFSVPSVKRSAIPRRDLPTAKKKRVFLNRQENSIRTPRRVVLPLSATIPITTPPHNPNGDTVLPSSVLHLPQEDDDDDDDCEAPSWLDESFVSTTVAGISPPRVDSPITTSTPTTMTSEAQSPSALLVIGPESQTPTAVITTAAATTMTIADRHQLSPLVKDLLHRAKIGFYFGLHQLSPLKKDLLHRAKIGFYFGVWYALNVAYNGK